MAVRRVNFDERRNRFGLEKNEKNIKRAVERRRSAIKVEPRNFCVLKLNREFRGFLFFTNKEEKNTKQKADVLLQKEIL